MVNLGLSGLVLLLALVAYFEPGMAPPAERVPLTRLTPETVDFIRIHDNRGRDLVMERRQGRWQMTRPYRKAVDEQRVRQLLGITTTHSFARFGITGAQRAEFGLDPPLVYLQLNGTKLEIGGNEPIQFRRYVYVADRLHLISNGFHHHLMAQADDFLEREPAQ